VWPVKWKTANTCRKWGFGLVTRSSRNDRATQNTQPLIMHAVGYWALNRRVYMKVQI